MRFINHYICHHINHNSTWSRMIYLSPCKIYSKVYTHIYIYTLLKETPATSKLLIMTVWEPPQFYVQYYCNKLGLHELCKLSLHTLTKLNLRNYYKLNTRKPQIINLNNKNSWTAPNTIDKKISEEKTWKLIKSSLEKHSLKQNHEFS